MKHYSEIREQIINDTKFRQRCGAYGLDWNNCDIYDDVILLNTPTQDLYVLFDKNYNTIGVVNWKTSNYHKVLYVEDFIKNEYTPFMVKKYYDDKFNYPFESFSLKQIIDLSNRIEIMGSNLYQPLLTIINGDYYDRNLQENEEYFQLASYVKFLGEEIKKYFLISYHMQSMGYEFPDIISYVRTLITRVNECIDGYIKKKKRPYPSDVLSFIGQNYRELNMNCVLSDVINLLLKDKGYAIEKRYLGEIETITSTIEKKDLSLLAQELLEILKLSDEDLKIKIEIERQRLIGDSQQQSGPVLKKKLAQSKNAGNK